MKAFSLLYETALHLYALGILPKIGVDAFLKGKYRTSFFQRFGFKFATIDKNNRPLVWVHAVSVGETRAIAPIVKRIKCLPNPPRILFSCITETGYAEARRCIAQADWHVFLPFDFSYIIGPMVKRIQPDLILLSETDFWFNFQHAAKKMGSSLILLNGKISERSFKRMLKFKSFAKHLIDPYDLLCVQTQVYAERFHRLKIAKEKVIVTGNLKLDHEPKSYDIDSYRNKLGLCEKTPVITLGSTHFPEEGLWIEQIQKLWHEFPKLKVILAPRHPERIQAVQDLLVHSKIPFALWSQTEILPHWKVLLVDTMGDLCACYQLSTLAFVGGSFCRAVGGHNIIEPLFYGVPVFFGGEMHAQPGMLELVKHYGAGIELKKDNIAAVMKKYLISESDRMSLVSNGLRLIMESKGGIDRCWAALEPYLALHQIKGAC